MGGGSYNVGSRSVRATSMNYAGKSANQIFEQNEKRRIHESMEPLKAKLREARDSAEHPNSVPIIIGLDVTGSMGDVPMQLIREGLPHIMGTITEKGVPDAQLLFVAVGDTECDRYPLQVGQFESADLELDTWLTRTFLEGGGGGNAGESYLLAWYFAAMHTAIDSWEKRKQKGFIFTIGDEPTLKSIPKDVANRLLGDTIQSSMSADDALQAAQTMYNVYHIHITETSTGRRCDLTEWKRLLGQNLIILDSHKDIPQTIAQIVLDHTPKEFYLGATHAPTTDTEAPGKIRL